MSSNKALLVIDLQNDYFDGGGFPLWNTEQTLQNILEAIAAAKASAILVVLIQHIADPAQGLSPFFNQGTEGANIHPAILAAAPDAPVVIKTYADAFFETNLQEILDQLGINEIMVCGMMTQNCVTHTAISKFAEKYRVTILANASTTVNEMIHLIGLHAVSTRVSIAPWAEALA